MIGNSSAGVRESGVYSVPAIDIGIRQQGRYQVHENSNIVHVSESAEEILNVINRIETKMFSNFAPFGEGNSDERFMQVLNNDLIWNEDYQKRFVELSHIG